MNAPLARQVLLLAQPQAGEHTAQARAISRSRDKIRSLGLDVMLPDEVFISTYKEPAVVAQRRVVIKFMLDLGKGPTEIAALLGMTKSAITMNKRKLSPPVAPLKVWSRRLKVWSSQASARLG